MISQERFVMFPPGVAVEMRRTAQNGRPTSLQVLDDGKPTTFVARGYMAVFGEEGSIHVAACIAPGVNERGPGIRWHRVVPEIESYVAENSESVREAAEVLWGIQTW